MHENETPPAADEGRRLSEQLGLSVMRPAAWMRKRPDGTLVPADMLPDGAIEAVRTASGAWEPLYPREALWRVLETAKSAQQHNTELLAQLQSLRAYLAGTVTLLETLRTKGESRYCYVESRAGQMVRVAEAIDQARELLGPNVAAKPTAVSGSAP